MKQQFFAAAFVVVVSLSPGLRAMLTDWNDLDAVIGSGANRSALAIAWNDGHSGGTMRWGFFWDVAPGGGTVADLIIAITAADARLKFGYTDFGGGLGLFVDGIGLDANTDNDYDDAGDRFRDRNGGWAQTFVAWEGQSTDAVWSIAAAGISSTPVANNQVYGFSWNDSGGWPGQPPGVVPEPASIALIGLGLAALRARFVSHKTPGRSPAQTDITPNHTSDCLPK